MKRFIFIVFTLSLVFVSSGYSANNRKTKAVGKVAVVQVLTAEQDRAVESVKRIRVHTGGGPYIVGPSVEKMAGADGKVKWSAFEEEMYVDDVRTLIRFVEVSVQSKDTEGRPHAATFTWYYSSNIRLSSPLLVLDGIKRSSRYATQVFFAGNLSPPDE